MQAIKTYGLRVLFGLALWALLIGLAMGATVPSTGFFTVPNCASIPNPATNSVVCLQTTTTGGRTAGKMYVWNGSSYVEFSGSGVPAGPITTSGLTQATGKLLGRGTASTGAIEEITVGANLSLSGTTLNASAGAGGYATIQEEGSDLTQRTKLNFIGSSITCVDDSGNTRTNCTVSSGAAGALTLVESHTFTSNATSFTFSGLDGDADGQYLLLGRILLNGGTNTVTVRPNAASTNLTDIRLFNGGSTGDSEWVITSSSSSDLDTADFTMTIFASKSINSVARNRFMVGHNALVQGGTPFLMIMTGKWAESSTNITSIQLFSTVSSGIASGSYAALYKYTQ